MGKIRLGDRVELVRDLDRRSLKAGHQGVVVMFLNDVMTLVLFDNYHDGHSGNGFTFRSKYAKGYSLTKLEKIGNGCNFVSVWRLKKINPSCLLKSWKGVSDIPETKSDEEMLAELGLVE